MEKTDLVETGKEFELKGYVEEAIEIYRKILDQDPNNSMVRSFLGHCYASMVWKDFDYCWLIRASNEFKQAGNKYFAEGHLEDALEAYRMVLDLKGNDAESHFNIGRIFHKKGDLDKAKMYCETAISLNPKDFRMHLNLGHLYADKKMRRESISEYKRALELQPDELDALFNLGLAYYKAEQFKEAIETYRHYIDINRFNAAAYFNLALSYYRSSEFDLSRTFVQSAKKLGMSGENLEQLLQLLREQERIGGK